MFRALAAVLITVLPICDELGAARVRAARLRAIPRLQIRRDAARTRALGPRMRVTRDARVHARAAKTRAVFFSVGIAVSLSRST